MTGGSRREDWGFSFSQILGGNLGPLKGDLGIAGGIYFLVDKGRPEEKFEMNSPARTKSSRLIQRPLIFPCELKIPGPIPIKSARFMGPGLFCLRARHRASRTREGKRRSRRCESQTRRSCLPKNSSSPEEKGGLRRVGTREATQTQAGQ